MRHGARKAIPILDSNQSSSRQAARVMRVPAGVLLTKVRNVPMAKTTISTANKITPTLGLTPKPASALTIDIDIELISFGSRRPIDEEVVKRLPAADI
jgi:hypothetical protein